MNPDKLRGKIIEKYGSENSFANSIGISRSSLSLYLNLKRTMNVTVMNKMINALNLTHKEATDIFFE